MADQTKRPSLKDFDPYADRNGQDLGQELGQELGQDSPLDIGLATNTQADLMRDPSGDAQAARIASGTPGSNATEATEAETPPENLKRLQGDFSASATVTEALDRATASVGQDDGTR